MEIHLYTIVVDYKGGTYCIQVNAPDPAKALVEWVRKIILDLDLSAALSAEGINDLERVDWEKENSPSRYNQLINAWHTTVMVKGELCLIHVIEPWPKTG